MASSPPAVTLVCPKPRTVTTDPSRDPLLDGTGRATATLAAGLLSGSKNAHSAADLSDTYYFRRKKAYWSLAIEH